MVSFEAYPAAPGQPQPAFRFLRKRADFPKRAQIMTSTVMTTIARDAGCCQSTAIPYGRTTDSPTGIFGSPPRTDAPCRLAAGGPDKLLRSRRTCASRAEGAATPSAPDCQAPTSRRDLGSRDPQPRCRIHQAINCSSNKTVHAASISERTGLFEPPTNQWAAVRSSSGNG
jgi:hypothetical protein